MRAEAIILMGLTSAFRKHSTVGQKTYARMRSRCQHIGFLVGAECSLHHPRCRTSHAFSCFAPSSKAWMCCIGRNDLTGLARTAHSRRRLEEVRRIRMAIGLCRGSEEEFSGVHHCNQPVAHAQWLDQKLTRGGYVFSQACIRNRNS